MAAHKTDPHGYSVNDRGSELSPDEVEFGNACEEYRRSNKIKFLSCSQMLRVARTLGYSKYGPNTINGTDNSDTARRSE